ncbi:RICIN domain-containing protein [Spartinivicinus poritis]|uniref:RICIN domain-containing protein n=1 Tax=Spartinivicinus poritis TaxID=2994640 RepID=A0ABT5UH20_9GAMM|nr:RICIN domain-containing protein [Spartinivicinus sp. A2-2]MDE1465666.1 RICIN domain-containing protein [Spartinivicinus sp. A2-2]
MMKASHLLSLTLLGLSISAVNADEYQPLKSGSGLCLDVFNAGVADKTPVTPFSCHGGANQQWLMDSLGRLHPKNAPDKCLAVGRHVTYNKTAYITQCNNEMYLRWRWSKNTLQNQSNPYMVLDYYADRQLIGVWQFHGGPNQQWEWIKSEKPTTTTKPNKPTQTNDIRHIMISVNVWGDYNNRGWARQSTLREKGNFKLYNATIYPGIAEGYDLGNPKKGLKQEDASYHQENVLSQQRFISVHDMRGEKQPKQHSTDLLKFFKNYIGKVVSKERKNHPNKSLRFSLMVHGHGGVGLGSLFERRLYPEDARELFNYIIEKSGNKIELLDLATLCNESFWENISNFYPYANYILASQYTSGGMKGNIKAVSDIPEELYPEAFNSSMTLREIAEERLKRVVDIRYENQTGPSVPNGSTQKSKTLIDSSQVEPFVCSLKGIYGSTKPKQHSRESSVHDVKQYLLDLKAHGADQYKLNQSLQAFDQMLIKHVTNEFKFPGFWKSYRSYGLGINPTFYKYTKPVGKDLFEAFSEVMHQKPQCK